MPIKDYGVWAARPFAVDAETAAEDPDSPHIHLYYDDGTGGSHRGGKRASISVKSKSGISELVFWHLPDFRHPVTDGLAALSPGFHLLASNPSAGALDYLRGNLVDFESGRLLPHDVSGDANDLIDFIIPELQAAINRNATIYLFGEPYSDHQGIHDIHMNQGSVAPFTRYNGVWQDGGVIIHYPGEQRFAALFLAFGSQAIHTDETGGNALAGASNFKQLLTGTVPDAISDAPDTAPLPRPVPLPVAPPEAVAPKRVAIVAARVNPVGAENTRGHMGMPETVHLLNRGAQPLSIAGWRVLNAADEAHVIGPDQYLMPAEARQLPISVPLSNKGGLITLLDADGIKVDGVSYTKQQARREGALILFR